MVIQLDFEWNEIWHILEGVEKGEINAKGALSNLQLFQTKNRLGSDFYGEKKQEKTIEEKGIVNPDMGGQ